MEIIDELDKKILKIITQNARIPFKDVAEQCGVSRAAIHQRVQRMFDIGVIVGSGYQVNPKMLGYNLCVYIGLTLERGNMYKQVCAELEKIPDAMRSTLLFDNLRWQHNAALGLFCEGKTGLVGVDNKPLGVTVKVKAQLYMDKNAQKMKFYVEAAKDHWYFFYYDFQAQDLTIYSSVGTWEDKIKAVPLEQRKITKEGLGTFLYHVGTVSNYVPNWLNSFNRSAHSEEEDE